MLLNSKPVSFQIFVNFNHAINLEMQILLTSKKMLEWFTLIVYSHSTDVEYDASISKKTVMVHDGLWVKCQTGDQ